MSNYSEIRAGLRPPPSPVAAGLKPVYAPATMVFVSLNDLATVELSRTLQWCLGKLAEINWNVDQGHLTPDGEPSAEWVSFKLDATDFEMTHGGFNVNLRTNQDILDAWCSHGKS